MRGYVNGIDWLNAEAMKYWSFPKSYKGDSQTEIRNLVLSGDYYGALKVDGYYQRIVKDEDGNIFMIARNKNVKGEPVDKHEWVPQLKDFFESLPNGTVLLSECYIPKKEGSRNTTTLLGCLKETCIRRQKEVEKPFQLHLYIFDVCAFNNVSYVDCAAADRFKFLEEIAPNYTHPYVKWAHYYSGKKLWEALEVYLENGREGVVVTRKDCPIYFKRTPARMTIKVKKEIANTIDCIFTGGITPPTKEYTGKEVMTWEYWCHLLTDERLPLKNYFKEYQKGEPIVPVTKSYYYGIPGSLEIGLLKDDKIVPFGYLSGLEEEIKINHEKYKGRCIEVSAMEITPDKRLRHPKFVGFRDDLTIKDCKWEQIE